jgi:hypothetical protein
MNDPDALASRPKNKKNLLPGLNYFYLKQSKFQKMAIFLDF